MSNRTRDNLIEFDPDNIDSTTIKYLNREQCTRAELYVCIDKLLEEVRVLELAMLGYHDDDDDDFEQYDH